MYNPFKKAAPKETPVDGFGERFQNMVKNNFQGLIGTLIPLCICVPLLEKYNNPLKLKCMWGTMLWFYLIQPVCIPVTSLLPVFMLPLGGIMNSIKTCKSYMNETVMLYVLSGWLILLLNNSGLDKRIGFWFMHSDDTSQYTAKKMVFKCGTAAFFLSMFSNKLLVTNHLVQVITNSYAKVADSANKADASGVMAMRDVVNNAIQTSSAIGGTAIIHSSIVNLLFRGCFQELAKETYEYADIFNYLQYSAFALPVAFAMFICNIVYHMLLISKVSSDMSAAHHAEIKKMIGKENAAMPPSITLHEVFTGIGAFLYLMCVLFRWNNILTGWADYTKDKEEPIIPGCKDATVAAIFVIILHILPKGFSFLKVFGAQKKKDLPPHKPESAILWYRFVDKNINYAYMFTYGSAFAILHAATLTELDHQLGLNSGKMITGQHWNIGIIIIIVVAAILCNLMTPLAACSIWLPYVLLITVDGASPWPTSAYLAALGVGIASNFGFCVPYKYTPAYHCHHTGKVPIMKMVKYSIPSVIICSIILYIALLVYAPFLWDPSGDGFMPVLPATNVKKGKTPIKIDDTVDPGAGPAPPPPP